MLKIKYIIIKHLLSLLVLTLAMSTAMASNVAWQAHQKNDQLIIQWWLQGDKALSTVKGFVKTDGIDVPLRQFISAPDASLSVCYLFMTDTSLSMKGYLKKQVIPLLTELVNQKQAQHQYAIGRFDASLEMLTTFSDDSDKLHEGIKEIQAKGKRTELFRAGLKGIKQLEQCNGYRKIMVILSDGDAEDLQGAYNLQDVVTETNAKKVSIISVSFKDSIKRQNLIKLSEATGGVHFPYQQGYIKSIAEKLLLNTDNGGRLVINLLDFPENSNEITLTVTLTDNTEQTVVLNLSNFFTTKPKKKEWDNLLGIPASFWVIGFIIFLIVIFILISLKKQKKTETENKEVTFVVTDTVETTEENRTPIAKIESNNEIFIMDATSISIGALPENDFVIINSTVGRHQAIIDYKDNKFYLTDRGATNTTQVNGIEVHHCELQNGDELRFGNWEGEIIFFGA